MEDTGAASNNLDITKELTETGGQESHTFDIDKEVKNDESVDYEEKRVNMKLSPWKSALLLFQGTVGLSMFTLQKPLQMTGLYWGIFVTAVVGYVTSYGLIVVTNLAVDIESDFEYKTKIKNFDELTSQIKGRLVKPCKWLMMISGVGMMFSSTISNLLLITTNLSSTLEINEFLLKGIIFAAVSVVFLFLVEPEKIQYINGAITTLLFSVACLFLGKNLYLFADSQGPPLESINKMDIKYSGTLAGNVAFAFEVASNFLSMRLTASNEFSYSNLTKYMMLFVGFFYYLLACSFNLAYPPEAVTSSAFEMQSNSSTFWRSMIYVFMVNTLYTFTFNTIFSVEIFESIPSVQQAIANKQTGKTSGPKIVILRIVCWAIPVVISFWATNIVTILNISGSLFTPIISFFGPMYLKYSYASQKGKTHSWGEVIHDTIYLLISTLVSVWGIVNIFHEHPHPGKKN